MIHLLRLVLITLSVFFVVLKPLRANLLVYVGKHGVTSHEEKIVIFNQAAFDDKCNTNIINDLAESYVLSRNMPMAAVVYGQGIICSPADSLLRLKFGEALLDMSFKEGKENVREAWLLEPNNPIYVSELNRVMALR